MSLFSDKKTRIPQTLALGPFLDLYKVVMVNPSPLQSDEKTPGCLMESHFGTVRRAQVMSVRDNLVWILKAAAAPARNSLIRTQYSCTPRAQSPLCGRSPAHNPGRSQDRAFPD